MHHPLKQHTLPNPPLPIASNVNRRNKSLTSIASSSVFSIDRSILFARSPNNWTGIDRWKAKLAICQKKSEIVQDGIPSYLSVSLPVSSTKEQNVWSTDKLVNQRSFFTCVGHGLWKRVFYRWISWLKFKWMDCIHLPCFNVNCLMATGSASRTTQPWMVGD